jgi:hypothetical protein
VSCYLCSAAASPPLVSVIMLRRDDAAGVVSTMRLDVCDACVARELSRIQALSVPTYTIDLPSVVRSLAVAATTPEWDHAALPGQAPD